MLACFNVVFMTSCYLTPGPSQVRRGEKTSFKVKLESAV